MEVVSAEVASIAQRQELQAAQRETYQDSRARYLVSSPAGKKGEGKGKSKDKKADPWNDDRDSGYKGKDGKRQKGSEKKKEDEKKGG